jgi:positive regulator of sigma E activity
MPFTRAILCVTRWQMRFSVQHGIMTVYSSRAISCAISCLQHRGCYSGHEIAHEIAHEIVYH